MMRWLAGPVVVLMAFLSPGLGRAEIVAAHVADPAYESKPTFRLGDVEIRSFSSVKPAASGEGQCYFLVYLEKPADPAYGYRVDRLHFPRKPVRLVVRLVGRDVATDAPRVVMNAPAANQSEY